MAESSGYAGWYARDVATSGDRLTAARDMAGQARVELAMKTGVRHMTFAGRKSNGSEPRGNQVGAG